MTLHDCGMALLHPHAANFFLNGKRPRSTGNPHPNRTPYSKFQTRTCEIFVAAGNDPAFRKFCESSVSRNSPGIPRFATNGARVINRDALTKKLDKRFANEDGHELTRRMLAAGLPAGPVLQCRRGDGRRSYRAPGYGDGTRRLSRPRHADQAVADARRHARGAAALCRAHR